MFAVSLGQFVHRVIYASNTFRLDRFSEQVCLARRVWLNGRKHNSRQPIEFCGFKYKVKVSVNEGYDFVRQSGMSREDYFISIMFVVLRSQEKEHSLSRKSVPSSLDAGDRGFL